MKEQVRSGSEISSINHISTRAQRESKLFERPSITCLLLQKDQNYVTPCAVAPNFCCVTHIEIQNEYIKMKKHGTHVAARWTLRSSTRHRAYTDKRHTTIIL